MDQVKFFYDIFSPDDICGMYTVGHFIMIFYFVITSAFIIYFLRNISPEKINRILLYVAGIITAVEIIKIVLRIIKHQWYDSWIPLYFCSLFIFAVWFSLSKNEFLKNIGCSFITMGGLFASIVFCFYPSTSLAIYPIWHPESIHSYNYHIVMFCTGVIMLTSGYYRPKMKHAFNYFMFVSLAAIPSLVLNLSLGTNCLFLSNAYGLPILQPIIDFSPFLYGVLAFLGQAVLVFWFDFILYKIIITTVERRRIK